MAANIPHVDGELPAYDQHVNARADPQVEHSFRLMKGGHPFLEVVLLNRAESVEAMPLLSQRQTLAGTVTLNLLEGINIRSISVQVCFSVMTAGRSLASCQCGIGLIHCSALAPLLALSRSVRTLNRAYLTHFIPDYAENTGGC